MDSTLVVRKLIVAAALCVCLARCEPPALSNQYGVPGNYAGPQGSQYQQQQQQYNQQQQQQYNGGVTNSYGAPLGGNDVGGGHHGGGGGHDEHQDYIDSQPKSYEFGYAVKDAASGNDFGRRETSDGETVRGEYRVQLPDGRTQIVTYTADWRTGFHADVRYEGVAQYPDQYNNGNQGYNNNNGNVNNGNNGNHGNQGYNNNQGGNQGGYDYAGNSGVDGGYNNAGGNHGGYNNYQGTGSNAGYAGNGNYQYGSNSIDSGSGNAGYFGPSVAPPAPQPQYGVPFH